MQARLAHYAISIIAAGMGLATNAAADRWMDADGRVFVLFVAVVIASVLGGLGPGLVATSLTVCGERWLGFPAHDAIGLPDLRLLIAEGIVMSFLGGGLMALRRRGRDTEAENQDLERRVLEIGEAERQRIGHDLHDGLGQLLTGIVLLSESMAQQIQGGRLPETAQAETVTRLVGEAIGHTRDLARNLAPLTLERDGLLAALEELSQNAPLLLGVSCQWQHTGMQPRVGHNRALHLYRIAQEAVSNSVKHGKAKTVAITLHNDERTLRLTIVDDGSGLSSKTIANPGLGLRIMRYRARMIDALLTVERAGSAGGTIVTCICQDSESILS